MFYCKQISQLDDKINKYDERQKNMFLYECYKKHEVDPRLWVIDFCELNTNRYSTEVMPFVNCVLENKMKLPNKC